MSTSTLGYVYNNVLSLNDIIELLNGNNFFKVVELKNLREGPFSMYSIDDKGNKSSNASLKADYLSLNFLSFEYKGMYIECILTYEKDKDINFKKSFPDLSEIDLYNGINCLFTFNIPYFKNSSEVMTALLKMFGGILKENDNNYDDYSYIENDYL